MKLEDYANSDNPIVLLIGLFLIAGVAWQQYKLHRSKASEADSKNVLASIELDNAMDAQKKIRGGQWERLYEMQNTAFEHLQEWSDRECKLLRDAVDDCAENLRAEKLMSAKKIEKLEGLLQSAKNELKAHEGL